MSLDPYSIELQENLIDLIPSCGQSHWIQMNFYPNPDGPAVIKSQATFYIKEG
jgi:hypothetical protein